MRFLRPDSSYVWENPMIRDRFARYYDIIHNKRELSNENKQVQYNIFNVTNYWTCS